MRRHFQCVNSCKEGAINDPVDAEESTKNLTTKYGKLWGGVNLHFILGVDGKFAWVVQLFFDPSQNQIDVVWCGYANCRLVDVGSPTVLNTRGEAFTRFET